jgi:hypothetical protein
MIKHGARLMGQNSRHEVRELFLPGHAQEKRHLVILHLRSTKGDNLIEERLGIAHAPLGSTGNAMERRRADVHAILVGDMA